MIERFYLKDAYVFKEVDIEFKKGLILFSGASGAGKSVLLDSMLGAFGIKDLNAKKAEVLLDNHLDMEDYGIENEPVNIFRFVKSKSSRYFINDTQVSKKTVKKISLDFVDYLSLKSYKEFENSRILTVLDELIAKNDTGYKDILREFKDTFLRFEDIRDNLQKIEDEEKKVEELKEFALYEIKKIEDISPKVGEYEELMNIKKSLSKKEKILEAIQRANPIFEYESYVSEALGLLEKESSFFDESLNELRAVFEIAVEKLSEYNDEEIENILDRLEKLSSLKQRYGSVEETLKYLEDKKEEIKRYENLSYEKDELLKSYKKYDKKCKELSKIISKNRKEAIKELKTIINNYIKMLYLENIELSLTTKDMDFDGVDEVVINLWGNKLDNISTGEFNRVRLAFLSSFNDIVKQKRDTILVLDEVDANLSGKESMSIAKVLARLSKNYQIFAISHQPQLTSKADMHFLVYKDESCSKVRELKSKDEKIGELARMISGEKVGEKAVEFAKSLMEEK